MADGLHDPILTPAPKPQPWTEIFRCFQVALDPRKLVVAAGGILATSLGWYLLSMIFYKDAPKEAAPEYSVAVVARDLEGRKNADGSPLSPEQIQAEATKRFQRDSTQWRVLDGLAGPGGRIRSLPWNENRGENPYVFLSELSSYPSAEWFDVTWHYLKKQLPVMVEPLAKLLLPIIKLTDADASTLTRFYLLLALLWSVAVWAFAGGVITRIAAVQLSGKDRVSIQDAVKFVCNRYLSYVLAPVVPVGVIALTAIAMVLFGLICLIPILGDLLYALGMPLVILGGIMMAILLIGLVGYPLMYSTLSVEGSDTFDALSRAYNYVFQAPWAYAWYWIVAILYGAIVTFFVVFVASLMVYLGKWAICQTPVSEKQSANYLFINSPESFGWKELLLRGTDLQLQPDYQRYEKAHPSPKEDEVYNIYANPPAAKEYVKTYYWWNWIGAGVTAFWLTAVFLLMLGFSYSFFWSASTMIYLLMRQKVDEVELDEVFLEEDDTPPAPTYPGPSAPPPPITPPTIGNPTTLPMVKPEEPPAAI